MLVLDDLPRIQRELAQLKEEQSQAKGALDTLMKQLEKEHKCKTEEEAEALVKKLEEAELKILRIYNQEMTKVKQEFQEVIPDE